MGRPFIVYSSDEDEDGDVSFYPYHELDVIASYRFAYHDSDDNLDQTFRDTDYIQHLSEVYIQKYNDFLDKSPELIDIKAICLETRYTERVIHNTALINELQPAIVYTDRNWDVKPYIAPGRNYIHRLVNGAIEYGTIVYETNDARDLINCVQKMTNKFCQFCDVYSLMRIDWLANYKGDMFMYANIDTES